MDSSQSVKSGHFIAQDFQRLCLVYQTGRWAGDSDITRMIKNVEFHNVEFVIAHRLDGDVSSRDHFPAYEPDVLCGKEWISHSGVGTEDFCWSQIWTTTHLGRGRQVRASLIPAIVISAVWVMSGLSRELWIGCVPHAAIEILGFTPEIVKLD